MRQDTSEDESEAKCKRIVECAFPLEPFNVMNRGATTALPQPSSPSLKPLMSNQDEDDGDLSTPSSAMSWDHLRRQARQIENEIELKLASLSKLGASVSHSRPDDASSVDKPSQELETEELLRQVTRVLPMYVLLFNVSSWRTSLSRWAKSLTGRAPHRRTHR